MMKERSLNFSLLHSLFDIRHSSRPMQKLKNILLSAFLLASFTASAQQSELVKNYISQYKDLAIAEMQRTGVPASIKLAQGIIETMAGTSDLVSRSNNHFGIKCKSNWTGETVKHDDDYRGECFRKYPSPDDSYRDHSDFLKNNQRYGFLFNLEPTDYSGWAWGLKKAGYATSPRYAMALIKAIEDYGLQTYSLIAMGKITDKTTELVKIDIPSDGDQTISHTGDAAGVTQKSPEPVPAVKKPEYPAGEFKINETKVVYVPKGTSYLAIAREYDVDLSKIFEFNELPRTEEVDRDRLIYLQRKRKTGNNEFHTVRTGETLHDIAQQQAIRLETLLELNWLKNGELPAVGEQLSLQRKASSNPKLALNTNHTLLPGAPLKATN